MFFFEAYVCKIISYDLINTFFYQNLTEIPRLKKITLNFGYQKSNFKHLVSSLLALEFITSRKGKMTTSRHLNVFLKIIMDVVIFSFQLLVVCEIYIFILILFRM